MPPDGQFCRRPRSPFGGPRFLKLTTSFHIFLQCAYSVFVGPYAPARTIRSRAAGAQGTKKRRYGISIPYTGA